MTSWTRPLTLVVAITIAGFTSSACSDSTQEQAERAIESAGNDIGDAVNDSVARAQAEAFRGSLVAQELDGSGRRNVDTLVDAANNLPDGTVTGIDDSDRDGVDDDGLVQIESDDQTACVRIAPNGDVTVTDDACF